MTQTIVSGKYAVNLGDCTGWNVHHIKADTTSSDVVHVNGPATNGHIGDITSDGSGDDIVSVTGGDFYTVHQMADCQGDITDLTIETIKTARSTNVADYARAVLLLAGQSLDATIGYKVQRVTVRDIKSRLSGTSVVWVGGDSQDNNTQHGSYSDIVIDDVVNSVASGAPAPAMGVRLRDGVMTNIEVRSVRNLGGAKDVLIDSTATVTGLKLVSIPRSRINNLGKVTGLQIAGDRPYGKLTGSTCETGNRLTFGIQVVTLVSGTLYLSYFRPDDSLTALSLSTMVRGAAASGATLARVGIYEANKPSTDDLLLVASTPNDPASWPATYAGFTKALSTTVTLDPLKVYCVGILFVGGTGPQLIGITGMGGELKMGDRLAASMTGQTDLPASISSATMGTTAGKFIYTRING